MNATNEIDDELLGSAVRESAMYILEKALNVKEDQRLNFMRNFCINLTGNLILILASSRTKESLKLDAEDAVNGLTEWFKDAIANFEETNAVVKQ